MPLGFFAKVHNPVYMFLRRLSSLIGLANFDGFLLSFSNLGVQSGEKSEKLDYHILGSKLTKILKTENVPCLFGNKGSNGQFDTVVLVLFA